MAIEVNICYDGKTKEHSIIIVDTHNRQKTLQLTPRKAKGLINMIQRKLEVIGEVEDA